MSNSNLKQLCINGHNISIVGRDKGGHCKECRREFRQNHKEEIKKQRQDYYKNNKEKVKQAVEEYVMENRDKVLANKRKYVIEHKEEKKQYDKKRYQKIRLKILSDPKIKEKKRQYKKAHLPEQAHREARRRVRGKIKFGQEGIIEFYNNCPDNNEVDHIIPLLNDKVSGLHVSWNLQYLTIPENRSKGNKCDLMEISEWYGKLLEKFGLKEKEKSKKRKK